MKRATIALLIVASMPSCAWYRGYIEETKAGLSMPRHADATACACWNEARSTWLQQRAFYHPEDAREIRRAYLDK